MRRNRPYVEPRPAIVDDTPASPSPLGPGYAAFVKQCAEQEAKRIAELPGRILSTVEKMEARLGYR